VRRPYSPVSNEQLSLCRGVTGHRARSANSPRIGFTHRNPYFIKQYPAFWKESYRFTPSRPRSEFDTTSTEVSWIRTLRGSLL
jgi:hypothetical protein